MKCPSCGHWNKPSFPRCFKCGEPLSANEKTAPVWQEQFDKPRHEKKSVIYDDATPAPDAGELQTPADREALKRDESLAEEMLRLKDRRERGEAYLDEIRRNAAEQGIAPSGANISVRRSGGFFSDVPDNPEETVYPPPEIRSKLRGGQKRRAHSRAAQEEAFEPMPADADAAWLDADLPPAGDTPIIAPPPAARGRRRRRRGPVALLMWTVRVLAALAASFLVWQGVVLIQSMVQASAPVEEVSSFTIEDIVMDDGYPGRRVRIAGEEGSQVYVQELTRSYVTVGGYATIEVADYMFYDSIPNLEMAQIEASLTPTVIMNGEEKRMAPITYMVDIPLSPIKLLQPEANYVQVSTSIYNMVLHVEPGSKVYVNGEDITDTVDDNGQVSYNPPVRAIGENIVTVTVTALHHRENHMTVTFYREPQDIPLELSAATTTTSSKSEFTINATTMVGATVTVETPYVSINTSSLSSTGDFSVVAELSRVGYNTIRLRASYPGKPDSVLEHSVYYLPTVAIYSKKAWALSATDYTDLLNNITLRVQEAQIYKCQGIITEILADNPQLAMMNTGTSDSPQMVLLQNESTNYSEDAWVVGQSYRVYADVNGLYNGLPRLVGRYTYDPDADYVFK